MIDFSSCTHKRLHLDVIIHGSLTHVHISVDCSLALRSSGTWKQVTPEEDKAWKFLCLCYSQHVRDDNKPRMAFRALSCKMWRHRRFSNTVEMKSNENRLLELGTRYWRRDITRNEKKVYPPPFPGILACLTTWQMTSKISVNPKTVFTPVRWMGRDESVLACGPPLSFSFSSLSLLFLPLSSFFLSLSFQYKD